MENTVKKPTLSQVLAMAISSAIIDAPFENQVEVIDAYKTFKTTYPNSMQQLRRASKLICTIFDAIEDLIAMNI